jgi:hypothetical protein
MPGPQIPPDFEFPSDITILNGTYAPLVNFGPSYFIGYDLDKVRTMPDNVWEVPDAYSEKADEHGIETIRTYICPWSQRSQMLLWLKGTAWRYTAGAISRIMPAQDPCYPAAYCASAAVVAGKGAWVNDPGVNAIDADGATQLTAQGNPQTLDAICFVDNSVGGWAGTLNADGTTGNPSGNFGDGKCLIRAVFRSVPYEIRSDKMIEAGAFKVPGAASHCERRFTPAIEALPLSRLASATSAGAAGGDSAFGLVFTDPNYPPGAPKAIQEPGVLQLRTGMAEWRWYNVPDPNLTFIGSQVGKVNLNTVDGTAWGFPGYEEYAPETLLFTQPQFTRQNRDVAGQTLYTLIFRALIRRSGWNRLPAGNGRFYRVSWASGRPLYESFEFANLFSESKAVKWQD